MTNTSGIADQGVNAKTWKGVQDAAGQFGLEAVLLEPASDADYASSLQTFVDQGCRVIVTVGSFLDAMVADATMEAANAHPEIPFSIVDYSYSGTDITKNNVLGQVFNSAEAAYLAGYLAAGMTKTGTVGTFGGISIPPITDSMDAFYNGVQRYNADNDAKVKVRGWDPAKPETGLFTGGFDNVDDGRTFAQGLVDQGADIIMPMAGPVSAGSAKLATKLGPDKLMIIGVDSDQYEADPANQGAYLTSTVKNADVTTLNTIASVVDGTFAGGATAGTLANDGVGLAPFHGFDSMVPQALKDQIDALKAGIIDGSVTVGTPRE
jgi:basic membrane protein A